MIEMHDIILFPLEKIDDRIAKRAIDHIEYFGGHGEIWLDAKHLRFETSIEYANRFFKKRKLLEILSRLNDMRGRIGAKHHREFIASALTQFEQWIHHPHGATGDRRHNHVVGEHKNLDHSRPDSCASGTPLSPAIRNAFRILRKKMPVNARRP